MLDDRVLFVDDDQNVLDTFQRLLYEKLPIETALGGKAALKLIDASEPFAVIVSDLRMPEMDGIEFLANVRKKCPDTVRMMLTGNADLETAIHAVNEGNIFRLLTKPCPPKVMGDSLIAAIEQYRLTTGERELLENTVKGSIKLLTDILSVVDPEAFGRAASYQKALRMVSEVFQVKNIWDIEMAWMLSNLGHVVVPAEILAKMRSNNALNREEKSIVDEAPHSVCRIISNIPRLENVGQIILYQNKNFDGTGFPVDAVKGNDIAIEARILKLFVDLARVENPSHPKAQVLSTMRKFPGYYDLEVLDVAEKIFALDEDSTEDEFTYMSLKVRELQLRDILVADLCTKNGQLLISAGSPMTEVYLQRIRNFQRFVGVKEPIEVNRPQKPRRGDVQGVEK